MLNLKIEVLSTKTEIEFETEEDYMVDPHHMPYINTFKILKYELNGLEFESKYLEKAGQRHGLSVESVSSKVGVSCDEYRKIKALGGIALEAVNSRVLFKVRGEIASHKRGHKNERAATAAHWLRIGSDTVRESKNMLLSKHRDFFAADIIGNKADKEIDMDKLLDSNIRATVHQSFSSGSFDDSQSEEDVTDQELMEQAIAYRFNELNEIENEGFDLNKLGGVLDYVSFLSSTLQYDGVTATLVAKDARDFGEAVKDVPMSSRLELIKDYLDENEIVFPSKR